MIVPDGREGRLLPQAPPADPGELRERGRAPVRRATSAALLDVTDNLVDGEVVHPPDVRVLDEDDTYLVVAADKGTATFSDTANEVAEAYGFWLGDAFASGGSTRLRPQGARDHRARARGSRSSATSASSSIDPRGDAFTVVGIGDMSGDVFGNGMLLSDRIRLVAAYDHRHVFIDPIPDPDARLRRAQAAVRAGRLVLGRLRPRRRSREGGGVWPRTAKRIPLSEARAGARRSRTSSWRPTTSSARSCARRSTCSSTAASARSSRPRRDRRRRAGPLERRDPRRRARPARAASSPRAATSGSRAAARIEFARGGGRINADFIDNSAGVDCSDHEVNLKILLGLAERRGELTRPDRDALLRDVTDDVVAHVLYDSFLQAQIIAAGGARARAARIYAYEDLMGALEEDGLLRRAVEALPTGEEMGERRRGRARDGAPGAGRAARLREAAGQATRCWGPTLLDDPWLERDLRALLPADGGRALRPPARSSTRCGAS